MAVSSCNFVVFFSIYLIVLFSRANALRNLNKPIVSLVIIHIYILSTVVAIKKWETKLGNVF